MTNKYYIKTFGCQMNEYDSEKIGSVLSKKNQLTETSMPEDADLIILNTCSIREKAEVKVFSDLGRFRELKEKKLVEIQNNFFFVSQIGGIQN